MALGREIDFVGHNRVKIENFDVSILPFVDNYIYESKTPETKWIEESTNLIGDWRAIFTSTYIRWALSINGLHVAEERYKNPDFAKKMKFTVSSLRMDKGELKNSVIQQWDGYTAAESHLKTVGMLSAWAIIDLYSCLEDFVFTFYRIFWNHNPGMLIRGKEHQSLRKLFRESKAKKSSEREWKIKWNKRLKDWEKNRRYAPLGKVFLSYCNHAKLEKPPKPYETEPINWSETLEGIGILRNGLIHGVTKVVKELEDFSKKPNSMMFDFEEGKPLIVKLYHLQSVELFINQLLTVLNLSLLQRGMDTD